jgi:hypothetical protein
MRSRIFKGLSAWDALGSFGIFAQWKVKRILSSAKQRRAVMLKRYPEARKILGAASIAFVTYLAQGTWAATRYVDGSGQYWPSAYRTIQQGIDAASDGDTVQVMGIAGAYSENIHFDGKDIVVTGIGSTVIAPGGIGPVVTFAGTEGDTCRLHGFIIQSGRAGNGGGICGGDEHNHTHAAISNNVIVGNRADHAGGGIAYCDGDISDNEIAQNRAADSGGGLHECNGTIENNVIVGNEAGHAGGGIAYCDGDISGNTIAQNHAADSGGGLHDCDGSILGNVISENTAASFAGGLSECDGLIQGNVIRDNSADDGGGLWWCWGMIENNSISGNQAVWGGGLSDCHGKIRNNVITANTTALAGGGLYDCDGIIANNTIVGNSAFRAGGALSDCDGAILNCIIWGNGNNENSQITGGDIPCFSCIQNWTGGGLANISEDPRFADPDGPDDDPDTDLDNDFRLSVNSPCVDVGMNENWMWNGTDKDNQPRIFYGHFSKTVDMGAYEFGSWDFRILSVESEPGLGVLLSWRGRTTALTEYTVWSTSDLSFGEWVQEADVTSIHTPVYWRDATSGGHTKFYKVEIK